MVPLVRPTLLPVAITIFNAIDPLGRPAVTAGSDFCFRKCYPSVRPSFFHTFLNLAKQNKFQVKTMFTTGETVGLALVEH